MQTKVLAKKPKPALGRTNNFINNNQKNKLAANKKNVRTTDHKKLLQIMLNDPYAITREEFIVLQSAIGYRRAVEIREEAILRKNQRKLEQTNVAMNPISLETSKSEIRKDSDSKKEASKLKNNDNKNSQQMKKDEGNTSASSSSMQHNLRARLENISGMDLSNVSVHKNSEKPQQIGALAYTQGKNIYLSPGQEQHLPHEGWHVVQQMQGRVKPTIQLKSDTLVNDDAELEKEADIMGSKAVKEGSQSKVLQGKKSSKIHLEHQGQVIQGFGFNLGKIAGNVIKKVAKAGANGVKAVGNAAKQAAKAGANGVKAVGNVVKQAAKAGANGVKAVGNVVKHAAKAGANGVKAVGNVVKHAAKAGANGVKAVGNVVKHAAKAGANGVKAVGNVVKQAAKAGANGVKAVGNVVKHAAKAGANGIKTVGNIVKQGVKAGAKGLKTVSNLVKKGAKLGEKGLKIAYEVVKQGIQKGVELGSATVKKAKKQLSQAGGIKQNLSKRLSKLFSTVFTEIRNNPKIVFDAIKTNSKTVIDAIKNPKKVFDGIHDEFKNNIENFNKNDNMEWNDRLMYTFKRTSLYKSFLKITQSGKMQPLFEFAGFDRDEKQKGVYHSQQDALQMYFGYNDMYDMVFDLATDMGKEKYSFKSGGEDYIIWLWKGDYLNLGAGAEIGIYTGGEPHWITDESLAMPMELYLKDDKGNIIFEYRPKEKQWWCTGFNSMEQDRKKEELIAEGKLIFSGDKKHKEMYKDFKRMWEGNEVWKFDDATFTATFKWEK